MATTHLSDIYIDPAFIAAPVADDDPSTRAESQVAVLRGLAKKCLAHRARYEAAQAALKAVIEVRR